MREARAEAQRQVENARNEIQKLEAHLAELDRARRSHLIQLRMAVERHLSEIIAAENAPGPQIPGLPRVNGMVAEVGGDAARAGGATGQE